jgi:hypothetical protein
MKLALAAPTSGLPFLSTAFGSQKSGHLTIEQPMLASISSWLTAFLPGAPTAAT